MIIRIIIPNLEDLKDLSICQQKLELLSINRQTGECTVETDYEKHLNRWVKP